MKYLLISHTILVYIIMSHTETTSRGDAEGTQGSGRGISIGSQASNNSYETKYGSYNT